MNRRGVSIIEIPVALAILTLAITASSFTVLSIPGILADARALIDAIRTAETELQTEDPGIRGVPLEDEHFSEHQPSSTWTTSRGETRAVMLSAIKHDIPGQEACDPFTSGDWSHPIIKKSYPLPTLVSPGVSATYSISGLAITPNTLAIAIGSTSQAAAPSLFLLSPIGTASPHSIGAFDNATISRIGTSAVAGAGNYVFAANAFNSASDATCSDGISCAQVRAYEVRGSNVLPQSSLTLATSSLPFAQVSDGSGAPATTLRYQNGFLYLGLQKTKHGDEFDIIDARDPAHMHWVSGYSIGRTVNDISIRGTRAFVSTDDPSRELMVFDVGESQHPRLISSWDAPGSSTFGYGSASTAYEDSLRFGRTYTANGPEFELLYLSEDGMISKSTEIDVGTSQDPESVRALLTQDRLTFMLLTHRLDILDTHDHTHASVIGTYPLPVNTTGAAIACRNNQLYLARNDDVGNGYIDILQGA